jgi:diaminopimelate epimerase
MRFWKYQATGNAYTVVEAEALDAAGRAVLARRACDPRLGVGGDGVLLPVPPPAGADAAVRILNPDGSTAEISGNGLRIFARWLRDRGHVGGEAFRVDTGARTATCRVAADGASATVAMGVARVVDGPDGPFRELRVLGGTVRYLAVDVGNPHAVVPSGDDDPDEAEARRLGPAIETHGDFPARTNVQLARVVARDEVRTQVWERGAGWTPASGSSACAVAAAFRRLGRVDARVRVVMPGGTITVTLDGDGAATLEGEVAAVAEGRLAEAAAGAFSASG